MTSPNISFDTIPSSIRKPGKYFEFNTRMAVNTLPGNPQRVLIVGQRLGDVVSNVGALQLVDVFSDIDAAVYFGYGSIAHRMVKAAITANPYVQLTVVAVDDAAAGVVSTGKITIAGAPTAAGAIAAIIAGQRVDLAVDSGDSVSDIAAALVTVINQTRELPVTASAAEGVVTLTAKHKGLAGNGIKLSTLVQTAGITAAVTNMAGGLNDPDLAPAFAAAFAAGHNIVTIPFDTVDALLALRSHVEGVSNAMEQRDAIGIAGTPGTLSAATTTASGVNSGYISLAWHNGSQMTAAQIAAGYASVVASEEDPARPLNTLAIAGLDVPDSSFQPGRVEQENALHNGVTPLEVGPGNTVQIVRAITTYTVNPEGVDDIALLDLTTIRTLAYARKAWRERIALRFPREKLSERTPPKVRSELLDVSKKMEDAEILENVDAWKDYLIVERDLQDPNRLDARLPADVVNGLHVFAGRIDLIL